VTTSVVATLIGITLSFFGHLAIAVYYYGRMSERVANHSRWLTDLEKTVNEHGTRISRLEGREARSESREQRWDGGA
jgi:hypothetical protein